MHNHILDRFFKPESIAIVGASSKENSIGRILIENLQKDGFPGSIYPINPKNGEILGIPAFPSITAVPASIDLAIVAVPIKGVPEIMQRVRPGQGPWGDHHLRRRKGSGRRRGGNRSRDPAAAQAGGIRYLGPNCMGILVPGGNLNASFAAHSAEPGSLALLSQSGAICSAILDWPSRRKDRVSHFVSVGSMADLGFRRHDRLPGQRPKRPKHHHLHGKHDRASQVHECGPLGFPGQAHHRGQSGSQRCGRQSRGLTHRGTRRTG